MLPMLRDLVDHKGHANAAMLSAIRENAAAAADPDVQSLLCHIVLVNRFWLFSIQGLPFAFEDESAAPASLDALIQRYASTHAQEVAWLAAVSAADLERIVEDPRIPGGRCTIGQALMQACMHSLGHRAQVAKLLRKHGGTPPIADFILWLADRPAAQWPAASAEPAAGVA